MAKQKYDEVVCFCVSRPDLDGILGKILTEQPYLLDIQGPLEDGTRRLIWKRDAPPIEVWEASGKPAQVRIRIAREDLDDVIRSKARYATQSNVIDLRDRLKRATRLVGFRSPDVGKGGKGPFRICASIAWKVRFTSAGVVMLGDHIFQAQGEVIR